MRAVTVPAHASRLLPGLAILALTLSGCGRSAAPVAPADRMPASALRADLVGTDAPAGLSANLFYPLDLGNHWGYDHSLALTIIPAGGPPGPTSGLEDRRERDIVKYVCRYQSEPTKRLASSLDISEQTLRNHLSTIYSKLGVNTRTDLISLAEKTGLIARG